MSQTPTIRPARRAAALISARSHLTAGIAVLGAGAIALSPVQPIPDHVALARENAVTTLAVELAATVNPIQAWVDTVKTTTANSTTLLKFYLEQPFPLAKTLVANQVTYLKELFSGNANLIFPQIKANIQTLFTAPLDPGTQIPLDAPPAVKDPVLLPIGEYLSDTESAPFGPASNSPKGFYESFLVTTLFPQADSPACYRDGDCLFEKAAPILNFLNTPLSGLLVGAAGVVLSPLVSLGNSVKAFIANLKEGKVLDALYEVLNIPANMTNALFNGAGYLELTKIVNRFVELPVKEIGLNLGGLLNAVPLDGSAGDPTDPPTAYTVGPAFNSTHVEVEYNGSCCITIPGLPNGLGGSMVGMGQYLAPKLKVTPPPPAAAVAPAAAAAAAVSPVVAEAPAAVVADAPASVAAATESAPAVKAEPAPVAVSAPQVDLSAAVSAPTRGVSRASAAPDAGGNDHPSRSRTGRGGR
jgi:hypothetical protein